MTERRGYYCHDCAREYPIGPRQKDDRVYELALRHAVNVHHKVGPKAHATIGVLTRIEDPK